MHFSLPIRTSLLLLLLPFQTLSSPTPDPIPGTLATQNGPITIPALSSGGAVQSPSGNTRIYYQSGDGSIHELAGIGQPGPNHVYVDQVLLPASKVRSFTPIAVADLSNSGTAVHIYYISPDDHLREYMYDHYWRDGTLNAANITTRAGSRFLVVLTVPWSGPGSGPGSGSGLNRIRVGYVATNGDLSEAYWDGDSWNRTVY